MRRFAVPLLLTLTISTAMAPLRSEEPASPLPSPVASPTAAASRTPVPIPTRKPEKIDTFKVHESLSSIWVDTRAPYPPEIDNETQARALARQAATALGQNAILQYVLAKKTPKGKTLAVAQVPSTEVQESVKGFIAGARVDGVKFDKTGCRLQVSVDKKNLKVLLKKA